MFAGLALDTSWWDTRNDKEVHIKRAVPDEQAGIEAVVLRFDTGQQTATDVLTDVRTGRYEPYSDDADAAYSFAHLTADGQSGTDGHPAEQWAEDLYQRLVQTYQIPERAVAVVGMGNDNHVYVPADPFSQEDVRAALRNEGYQPRSVEDGFGYRIDPDFEVNEMSVDGSEQKTWCPNCHEKGTVPEDCFRARCPDCGKRFDPRDYGPDNYEQRSVDTESEQSDSNSGEGGDSQ